jgi:uncharacterized tellurite resistance protein B-like protein
MTRIDDYLDLVDRPTRHALTPGHPADDAMLAMLVHVAFADRELDEGEVAFLQRVLPGRAASDLTRWVEQVAAIPLDMGALAAALPTTEERWKAFRFAVRMAWKDGSLQEQERSTLLQIASGLELGADAVERALREVSGRGTVRVEPSKLSTVLREITWSSVDIVDEDPPVALARTLPPGARVVRCIAVDDVVVLAIAAEGIAGSFLEGVAFIPWAELVTYTRVPSVAAAVQLHTERGRSWSLVDARLRGLVMVLDRVFGVEGS